SRRASASSVSRYFTTKRGVISRRKPASARHSRSTFSSSRRADSLDGSRSSTALRFTTACAGLSRRSWRWASSSRTSGSYSARARKLAGTVQADGFLGERLSIAGTEGGEHDGSLRGAPLVATAFAPAEQQRRGAEQQRGEGEQADVRDERHARAQRAGSIRNRDWPNSTGCAFSTKILTTRPATLDSISFMSFIASMMQRIWPSFTTSPSLTYGSAVGDDAR